MDYERFKSEFLADTDDWSWLKRDIYDANLASMKSIKPFTCFRGMVWSRSRLDQITPETDLGFYWSPNRSTAELYARNGHLDICDAAFEGQILVDPVSVVFEVEFAPDQIDTSRTLFDIYRCGVRGDIALTGSITLVPRAECHLKAIYVNGDFHDSRHVGGKFVIDGSNGSVIYFDPPLRVSHQKA